jgi:hypothetical protein
MELSAIQAKVYKGYARAASVVGSSYDALRVNGADNPVSGTPVATLMAQFTPHSASNFSFNKPSDFKSPLFHAMLDGSLVQVGDYLVGVDTYFLAGLDPLQPPLAVACNHVISLYTRAETDGEGVQNYGSHNFATDTPLALNWPASELKGSRAVNDTTLPGDAGFGMFDFILPVTFPVTIVPAMLIRDDLGFVFVVQVADKTANGWRITAKMGVV